MVANAYVAINTRKPIKPPSSKIGKGTPGNRVPNVEVKATYSFDTDEEANEVERYAQVLAIIKTNKREQLRQQVKRGDGYTEFFAITYREAMGFILAARNMLIKLGVDGLRAARRKLARLNNINMNLRMIIA